MQKLPGDIIVVLSASNGFFYYPITVVLLMANKRIDCKHPKGKRLFEEDFNRQLLRSQIEIQEQTCSQIGKELHDNVGQLLSASRMLIGLAERSLQTPPDTLLTANATIAKAINELRSLSKSLDKDWLSQFNLLDKLKAEMLRINAGNVVSAHLHIHAEPVLPSSKQIILFRIIQEAVENALKHSNCKVIDIYFYKKETDAEITVANNGTGFKNKGMGLKNMQYRIQLLGGTIHKSSTANGTSIVIVIPQTAEANDN